MPDEKYVQETYKKEFRGFRGLELEVKPNYNLVMGPEAYWA